MHTSKSLVVAVALVGAVACGGGAKPMHATQEIPAAQAALKGDTTSDGNTKLTVEVEHLAPPEKLARGARVYVVWAKPHMGDDKPQNLGAFTVDKDRKGKLETLTSLRKFEVVITPESSSQAEKPTHAPVLRGEIDRTDD
jgi:hypothetical protein